MKKLLGFLFAIVVFSACSKVDPVKDLPAGDGKWNFTSTTTSFLNGTQTSVIPLSGTMTFANGNVTTAIPGFPSDVSPYIATATNVTIGSGTDLTVLTITEKTKTSQTWTSSSTSTSGTDVTREDVVIKLTK
jgi:hypothetical protein